MRLEGIDALVTDIPGCCICISTADCIPILLYDKQHQAIAAVHAGWRGTVNFIVGHTLERMRAVYGTVGEEVVACIGPGISLESFEVGDEVYEGFSFEWFRYVTDILPECEYGKVSYRFMGNKPSAVVGFRCSFFTNRGSRYLYLYSS